LANLGAARMVLAEMKKDSEVAALALNDFDEVVNYFQEASHSQYMELGEEQRKLAQALITELSKP
jgi:hypothetical protein